MKRSIQYDYLHDIRIQEVTDALVLLGYVYMEEEVNTPENTPPPHLIEFVGVDAAHEFLTYFVTKKHTLVRYHNIINLKLSN